MAETITDLTITLDKDSGKKITPPSVTLNDNGEFDQITLENTPDAAFTSGDNRVSITYTSPTGTEVNQKAILNLTGDDKKTAKLTPTKSSVTLNFRGLMAIGPEPADPAVTLAVRFGNMNKNKDWIIDFSDKIDKKETGGTKINVGQLVNWLNQKNMEVAANEKEGIKPDSTAEELKLQKPELLTDEQFKVIMDYNIVFKEFHFNITKKTFKIEIESEKGQSLTIGAFTLENIGFMVTNEELTEEEVLKLA